MVHVHTLCRNRVGPDHNPVGGHRIVRARYRDDDPQDRNHAHNGNHKGVDRSNAHLRD